MRMSVKDRQKTNLEETERKSPADSRSWKCLPDSVNIFLAGGTGVGRGGHWEEAW